MTIARFFEIEGVIIGTLNVYRKESDIGDRLR
jgi:hypothetical protein